MTSNIKYESDILGNEDSYDELINHITQIAEEALETHNIFEVSGAMLKAIQLGLYRAEMGVKLK